MTDSRQNPAGGFVAWLDETRRAHADGAGIDVPCGDCVACCTSSYFVHVEPDEAVSLSAIPAELLFPASGYPEGTQLLGYDAMGRCPMLRDGRCSIYEQRPRTCRIYDCRVFAAAGLNADRAAITRRARRWKFDCSTEDDRAHHAAVRGAARFLRERAALFPRGFVPDSPADLAALAVRVCEVFLGRDDCAEGAGSGPADEAIVGAVLEEVEGMRRGGATDVRLRPTTAADLGYVVALEQTEENRPFIDPWHRDRHAAALSDPDLAHLIIESSRDAEPLGFVILSGLARGQGEVELRRIVVATKTRGTGRAAVRAVKQKAFVELGAGRLWLDMVEDNDRARGLYLSEGFVIDGAPDEPAVQRGEHRPLVVMSLTGDLFR